MLNNQNAFYKYLLQFSFPTILTYFQSESMNWDKKEKRLFCVSIKLSVLCYDVLFDLHAQPVSL